MLRIFLWLLVAVKVVAITDGKKCILNLVEDSHNQTDVTRRHGINVSLSALPGVVTIYVDQMIRPHCYGMDFGEGRILTAAHCLFDTPPPRGRRLSGTVRTLSRNFTIHRHRSVLEVIADSAAFPHRHYSMAQHRDKRYIRHDLAILDPRGTRQNVPLNFCEFSNCPKGDEKCYTYQRRFVEVRLRPCLNHIGIGFSPACRFRKDTMCIELDTSSTHTMRVAGAPVFCQESGSEKFYVAGILSESISRTNLMTVARIGRFKWL